MQLVLQLQALLLHFLEGLVRHRFLVLLDAPDVLVQAMVFIEEPGEMVIAGLQLVDGVLVLGKLVMQVVMLQFHDASLMG